MALRYPPPIVAQVDPLHVAGPKPLAFPVGVVPWDPEHDRTTIVVKTTYGFDPHAASPVLTLLDAQPGFTAAAPADPAEPAASPEADAVTDLVRSKPRADVVLRGYAHAARAVERIDARIVIPGCVDLSFCTLGPTPIERMPLTAGYLRARDGVTPIPPVGPLKPREVVPAAEEPDAYGLTDAEKLAQYDAAMRALYAGEWKPWEDAGVTAPLPPNFDDEEPDSQPTVEGGLLEPVPGPMWDDLYRTDSLTERGVQIAAAHLTGPFPEPDAVLLLEGLLPGGEPRKLALPGHDVLVIAELSAKYDVTMEIDTVELDTERGTVALTWRGQVPEDVFERSSVRLIVSLGTMERVPEVDHIYRSLPRGVFARAVAPEGADVGAIPKNDVELNVARQMTFDRTPDPSLQVEEYAELAAELWAAPGERDAVLARHGMTSTDWMLEERAWMEAVGTSLRRGDMEAVEAFNKMLTGKRRAAKERRAAEENAARDGADGEEEQKA